MTVNSGGDATITKIVIVGAGLGGLFAAIAFRTAGYSVEVYESSRFAIETGAAIHLPPNVNGLLRRYGMIPEDHGANQCEWVTESKSTGETVFSNDLKPLGHAFPYPWQLIHRIDLHNALKEIATRQAGKGQPVVINLQSRVKEVDCDAPSITLQDGRIIKGDLIVGADGIHSVTRNFVLGEKKQPKPSGTSAYRFLIPTSVIKADPKTAHFVERSGELNMISAEGKRIVMYPCRGNSERNFVGLHLTEEGAPSSEDWNKSGSKESLLKVYDDYQDDVKALLAKAEPDTIKIWKLLDMEALPFWTKGRVTLLGDAAHPFLPHQGQGGAQAMEDAAALAAVLPLGTLISEIPERLQLYTESRYQRATIIQEYSRDSGFKENGGQPSKRMMDPMQFTGFNFDHDAHDHATGILKRYLVSKSKYQRMPLAFGPTPSPRQDLAGRPRTMNADARYTTSFITFKTKKAYLQTLVPSKELNIKSRGGWTTATFQVTKLENLEWLGGRGYTYFALSIHNIVKGNPNGPPSDSNDKTGDIWPILFENLADPIITGREELNMPKVYADLESEQTSTAYQLKASWGGTSFCELKLDDLVAEVDSVREEEPLQYSQKSAAAIGKEADFELTPALRVGSEEKERRWKAGKASISFTKIPNADLEKMFPTLANIVNGLRQIEVVDIVASGIRASL